MRRSGKAIPLIAKTLGVAKSTAYLWTKDVPLTKEQKRNLLSMKSTKAASRSHATARVERDTTFIEEAEIDWIWLSQEPTLSLAAKAAVLHTAYRRFESFSVHHKADVAGSNPVPPT